MKKTLFLTAALLLATVSGQGAVTLLDGFSPASQSSSNSQVNWNDDASSFSTGWAVSFQVTIPNTVNNGDTLFSTGSGVPSARGWQFAFNKLENSFTLTLNNNGADIVFTTQSFTKADLANTPLTLVVRETQDNKSLITFYLGSEEIASGTSTELLSLTKGSSTFWANGSPAGRTQLSDIQGVTFDASDSNMDVLAALGIATVPEPATASLGILGLAALMIRRRRA